ncbi:MAG: hypothetical protein EPO21_18375 [Chloroflexota bacterium]|nr:MAG: hypothetical protein EPO21_18375 [Chloroflexota bacterium]
MKRRRLLILNAVLASLLLMVMSTGGALAFQPPLTALDKTVIDVIPPGPVSGGETVVYEIDFRLSADQKDVKIKDVLRGQINLDPTSVELCVFILCFPVEVVKQLDSPCREDWDFLLGDLPATELFPYVVVFEATVGANPKKACQTGPRVLNTATVLTSTGWKGQDTVITPVDP